MFAGGFGRSLVFGALAASAVLAGGALGPPNGPPLALLGWALPLLAVLYVAGIAPSARRGSTGGALAAALSMPLWLLPLGASAVGAALVISSCRSGYLYRARPLRAVIAESALLAGGLGLGHHLVGPSTASWALAVWGYFLVQSLFFLIGGTRPRARAERDADPFEIARARLLALLD